MGQEFAGVEKVMREMFLPRLFFRKSKNLPPVVGTISMLPLKKDGMGLHKPVTPAVYKYINFIHAIYDLVGAVMGEREFSTADHIQAVKKERWDGKED